MTSEPNVPAVPPMRASDHERELVASALQKAMSEGRITVTELEDRLSSVYAATTVADLVPITQDLPGQLSMIKPAAVVPVSAASGLAYSTASVPKVNLVGILSSAERTGVWTAPTHINAVAIMGGIELDFTSARLTGRETVIDATAIMGGIEITVPEGLTVIVQGVGILGGFVDSAKQNYGGDAPVLRVKGAAIMGGVEVKRTNQLPA